jgi:hypothetical protein
MNDYINSLVYLENGIMYPVNVKYETLFKSIKNALFKKIDKLLETNSITQIQYNEFVKAYNEFVFSIVVNKIAKEKSALEYAKEALI